MEARSHAGPERAETRRFLTFRAAGRLYALPAEDVREIVKPPPLAKVPLGPKALLGLGNLRGSVLPVAGLALLLNRTTDPATSARVVVIEGRTPLGLMVDAVETLTRIASSALKSAEADISASEGELLLGVFQAEEGAEPVKVLDLQALLAKAFGQLAHSGPARTSSVPRQAAPTAAQAVDQEILIAFDVAGQEFALPIANVIEVLPSPVSATALPQSESAVIGMVGLRGQLLPMLSLQTLLGLSGVGARAMTVIVSIGSAVVGLSVDGVREILRVDREALEPVPPVIASRTRGEARVQSVVKADGGRRLIAVLSPDQLFREDVMNRIRREGAAPTAQPHMAANAAERVFLVFSLGGQEYGLAVSAVEEVARLPEQITRLPRSPEFLKGVVNLRGVVLPIIDQRRRFDLPDEETGAGQRLVVVRIDANVAGFIVDGVSEVLRIPESAVDAAPDVVEGARVLEGVINLEDAGRMILLLDPAELLSRTEKGLLDALGRMDEAQSAVDQSARRG